MGELDLSNLECRSPEFLDIAYRKRLGDMVWRVCFCDGQSYILVLVEFQSEVDRRMAGRVREYTEMLLDRVERSRGTGPGGDEPWVLPIVLYNGGEAWTAPGQVTDLAPLPSEAMARDLLPLQPQAYRLLAAGGSLTSGARRAEDWPLDNRVSATVRLQASRTPQDLLSRLLEEAARFPGDGDRAFRQALHAWAKALWADRTGDESGFPEFEELERQGGAAMPTMLQVNWNRWEAGVRAESREEGIKHGVRQGIAQGMAAGRARLNRQAALKFGAATGERLAGLLEDLTSREDLDQVGDWIIECGGGDELLSRVSALRAKAGNGES